MDLRDEKIRRDILDRLIEAGIQVPGLRVDVSVGQVTLTGFARSLQEKTAIGRRASEVPGVLSVDNQLEAAEHDRISYDAHLGRRIRAALAEDPELSGQEVDVSASATAVVLAGTVDSLEKKARAEEIVMRLVGALGIANNIAVAPSSSPADKQMARAVENALRRSDYVESENVHVRVEGGRVTLSGTVSTWEAKKAAYDAAVFASAAEEVQDNLKISELK